MCKVVERSQTDVSKTILHAGIMDTGFYIDHGIIWGPHHSGEYWINGNRIWGPKSRGKFRVDKSGHILGPNTNGAFYIHGKRILGPNRNIPWMT